MAGRPRHRRCSAGTDGLRAPGSSRSTARVYTAEHVVLAAGADPVIPPVPGLRELDGIWTNREVTGMKSVPRRLLVLGGGPVGVEMAQAVRRLGGEVALVEGAGHVLPREAAPLGDALGEVLHRDGDRAHRERARDGCPSRRRRVRARARRRHASCAGIGSWSRPGGGRAWRGWAWRRSASSQTVTAFRSMRGSRSASACGRSATSRGSGS